jgi:hypothetical protein
MRVSIIYMPGSILESHRLLSISLIHFFTERAFQKQLAQPRSHKQE